MCTTRQQDIADTAHTHIKQKNKKKKNLSFNYHPTGVELVCPRRSSVSFAITYGLSNKQNITLDGCNTSVGTYRYK